MDKMDKAEQIYIKLAEVTKQKTYALEGAGGVAAIPAITARNMMKKPKMRAGLRKVYRGFKQHTLDTLVRAGIPIDLSDLKTFKATHRHKFFKNFRTVYPMGVGLRIGGAALLGAGAGHLIKKK